MKVLHIATQRGGGAGIAAYRIHSALRSAGVDSTFAALDCTTNPDAGTRQLPKRYLRFYERAMIKLDLPATHDQKHQRLVDSLSGKGIYYSSLESDYDLMSVAEVANAEHIHLHWTSGILNWPTFFERVRCPITWTFHDQQTYLGGFHYQIDLERASDALRHHNQSVIARQKLMLEQRSDLVCVSPSTWMQREAHASAALAQHRHEHIPYSLDTSIFRPLSQAFARDALGLPCKGKILAFIAENLSDFRKGGDLLHEALQHKALPTDWSLALAGRGKIPPTKHCIHSLGSIADERLMALLYNAADGFVLPSRQDNLPNVILESLCCGTPVISFATTGMPDMIQDNVNGVLSPTVDAKALAEALTRFSEMSFERDKISTAAHALYAPSIAAERYKQLYQTQ